MSIDRSRSFSDYAAIRVKQITDQFLRTRLIHFCEIKSRRVAVPLTQKSKGFKTAGKYCKPLTSSCRNKDFNKTTGLTIIDLDRKKIENGDTILASRKSRCHSTAFNQSIYMSICLTLFLKLH